MDEKNPPTVPPQPPTLLPVPEPVVTPQAAPQVAQTTQPLPASTEIPIPPPSGQKVDHGKKRLVFIIIALVVFVCIGVGIFFFLRGSRVQSVRTTPNKSVSPRPVAQVIPKESHNLLLTTEHAMYDFDVETRRNSLLYADNKSDKTILENGKYSPDKRFISFVHSCIVDDCSPTIEVMNVDTKQMQTINPNEENEEIETKLYYYWKDTNTIVFSLNNATYLYDVLSKKKLPIPSSRDRDTYVSDDESLAVSYRERKVMVEDLKANQTFELAIPESSGIYVTFSKNAEYFVVYTGAGDVSNAQVFDRSGKSILKVPSQSMTDIKPILYESEVLFSPDAKKLLILSDYDTTGKNNALDSRMERVGFITDLQGENASLVTFDFLKPASDSARKNRLTTASWQ